MSWKYCCIFPSKWMARTPPKEHELKYQAFHDLYSRLVPPISFDNLPNPANWEPAKKRRNKNAGRPNILGTRKFSRFTKQVKETNKQPGKEKKTSGGGRKSSGIKKKQNPIVKKTKGALSVGKENIEPREDQLQHPPSPNIGYTTSPDQSRSPSPSPTNRPLPSKKHPNDVLNIDVFESVHINDYVVVEFATKTKMSFYVGKVLSERDEDDDVEVSFLKRKCCHFVWPLKEDICSVHIDAIKARLCQLMETLAYRIYVMRASV